MKTLLLRHIIPKVIVVAPIVLGICLLFSGQRVHAAGCAVPATDYGSGTSTLTIPSNGTYRVWTRMMAPNATDNSYLLEIDGTSCYTVGDSAIGANAWTWVDYQNGSASAKLNLQLNAGQHTLRLIGREPNVKIDRLLFIDNAGCTPVELGENCTAITPTTPPDITLTKPTDGSSVSGNVEIAATATASEPITKVEFYIDGALAYTDTTSPYSHTWDSSTATNGQHTVMAKVYGKSNTVNSDAAQVTVANKDVQAPQTPSNLVATTPAYDMVQLSWKASTDNVGVAGYWVLRDGNVIAKVEGSTQYTDRGLLPQTTYTYSVKAYDAAGNTSPASTATKATTPNVADTQAPSKPEQVQATAASPTQINLGWKASTDNVGVKAYEIFRAESGGSAIKVATVTSTSFGDTSLKPQTTYAYYLVAVDAAGNRSGQSATVSTSTPAIPPSVSNGIIKGKVTGQNNKPLAHARVVLKADRIRKIVQTNSKGQYFMSGLRHKQYTLTFHAFGYVSKKTSVIINSGKAKQVNITLQKRSR